MGIVSSQEEFSSENLPSLSVLSDQNASAPEIYLNQNILGENNKNLTTTNIISEYLNSKMNLPPGEIKSNFSPKPVETPSLPINTKNQQNSTFDCVNTISTDSSDYEPNEINQANNNINACPNQNLDLSIKEAYNLDDSIDEPIKTMAGSLNKDIRNIYKFKDLLGGGHFGSVRIGFRRAEQPPLRLYAIKSISKQNLTEKDIEELTKEVDIISSLDHPNIINFYETYHDKFYFHIVMELCRGRDLLEKIKDNNGKICEKKVAICIMKVLHAISYCHEKGITHRDLKPENILFESNDPEAEIKLIDFGLSRKYQANEKMHTILGTPYYVAPEVLQGSYDEKCDIWSIGALTYLMLSGEPPFKGKSNKEIFHKILNDELKLDQRKWKGISPEAIDFVKQCLNKNPEQRPNALEALKHEWFSNLLSRVHSSIFINKDILYNLKSYVPGPRFRKIVMKYFINMLSHSDLKIYKSAFYGIGFRHSGTISRDEVKQAFEMSGVPLTEEEIKRIFYSSEEPNKQTLRYSEFIIECINPKKLLTKEKLKTAFNYFDIDNSGVIDASDVKDAMLRFGRKVLNEEDVYKMISEITKKETKLISFDDFYNMFKNLLEGDTKKVINNNNSNTNNNIKKIC